MYQQMGYMTLLHFPVWSRGRPTEPQGAVISQEDA